MLYALEKKGLGYTDQTIFARVLKDVIDKPLLVPDDIETIMYGVWEEGNDTPILASTTYAGDVSDIILASAVTADTRYDEDDSGYNFRFTIPAQYISARFLEFHFLLIHSSGSGGSDPMQQSLIFTREYVLPRITSQVQHDI